MRYPDRVTICVSSQAGCGMNCPFCATGQAGLTRNMSTGEIVEQVVAGARALAARRDRPAGPAAVSATSSSWAWASRWPTTSAVVGAVRRLTDPAPDGLGISAARHHRLHRRPRPRDRPAAGRGPPGDASRCPCTPPTTSCATTLVPVNTRWKVAEVLDAAGRYSDATRRRVSIEYALIRDINDQAWRADLLGRAAQGAARLVHVNLDPAQPDAGLEVDRVATRRTSGVRRAAASPRRRRRPSATPAAARSTAPAASSRLPSADPRLLW